MLPDTIPHGQKRSLSNGWSDTMATAASGSPRWAKNGFMQYITRPDKKEGKMPNIATIFVLIILGLAGIALIMLITLISIKIKRGE